MAVEIIDESVTWLFITCLSHPLSESIPSTGSFGPTCRDFVSYLFWRRRLIKCLGFFVHSPEIFFHPSLANNGSPKSKGGDLVLFRLHLFSFSFFSPRHGNFSGETDAGIVVRWKPSVTTAARWVKRLLLQEGEMITHNCVVMFFIVNHNLNLQDKDASVIKCRRRKEKLCRNFTVCLNLREETLQDFDAQTPQMYPCDAAGTRRFQNLAHPCFQHPTERF